MKKFYLSLCFFSSLVLVLGVVGSIEHHGFQAEQLALLLGAVLLPILGIKSSEYMV